MCVCTRRCVSAAEAIREKNDEATHPPDPACGRVGPGGLHPGAAEQAQPRDTELDRHQRRAGGALGTDDGKPRAYRYGYGVLDENLNMLVDPGEKKVYFEISDYTNTVFFENPR